MGVLVEREVLADPAGSYRSRALEEAMEVEQLKGSWSEERRIRQKALEVEHLKGSWSPRSSLAIKSFLRGPIWVQSSVLPPPRHPSAATLQPSFDQDPH